MRLFKLKALMIIGAVLATTACANKEPSLMNLKATQSGPDEFSILPTKPLAEPASYSELPAPTPGAGNLTDPTPRQDAVAALGGNGELLVATNVRGGETALMRHTGRYGINGAIRNQLAAEDLNWRKDNKGRVLERLFNVNVYYRAYKAMHLDQHYELARMRKAGVWTPASPPNPSQ